SGRDPGQGGGRSGGPCRQGGPGSSADQRGAGEDLFRPRRTLRDRGKGPGGPRRRASAMTAVFVDTVGMIAVWNSSDQRYQAADAAYRALLAQRRSLMTTDLVLFECGNAAARRPYRPRVNVLRQALMAEGSVMVPTKMR